MTPITSPADDLDYSIFAQQKDSSPMPLPQYTINEATHALWHVTHLLTILVDACMEAATTFDPTPAFQDYLAWILDSFVSLHELQKRWRANPQLQQSCIDSCLASFSAVELLLSSGEQDCSETVRRKGYLLFSNLCADLLSSPPRVQQDAFSHCRGILNLVALCKRNDSMRRDVSLHLLPSIAASLLDEDAQKMLGKDFQVRNIPVKLEDSLS
jgi:serine/threonine-protein kinase ATR